MAQIIGTEEAMKETPRPHYLVGRAILEELGENRYSLKSRALFPADEEHPSVLDRGSEKYLEQAHVNAGDALFASWNATHILTSYLGFKGTRTLRKKIITELGREFIVPDKEYDLTTIIELQKEVRQGEWIGKTTSEFRDGSKILMRVSAKCYACEE